MNFTSTCACACACACAGAGAGAGAMLPMVWRDTVGSVPLVCSTAELAGLTVRRSCNRTYSMLLDNLIFTNVIKEPTPNGGRRIILYFLLLSFHIRGFQGDWVSEELPYFCYMSLY